ncbi:hypothetical protein B0T14DRAFT_572098 [Immersiella caudata]|uniref:Uncharacterized protein n=1 Tax=Immersiella caudata TaxID=314043 RepID=A0AA39W9J7_9PEZI|nr:hypothetical protein B0T14DRAFT_572098 [Immersiella caudata]
MGQARIELGHGGYMGHGGSVDEWSSLFWEQKVQLHQQEDVPFWYVDTSLDTTISPTSASIVGPPSSEEILDALMNRRRPEHEPYFYQEVVRQFCSDADMTILANGNHACVTRPFAWLDDRNGDARPDERRGNFRVWKGALSAHQLYCELRKKRFRGGPLRQTRGYVAPEPDPSEPNAERRLLYIADPDSWAVLAVVATASKNQAAYLREFLFRHLTMKAFFQIHMPSGVGFPTYALEFHLPFYALKRYTKPIKDKRRRANGQPLRRSWYQTFLTLDANDVRRGWCPPGRQDLKICIHEGEISVMVTGFDERARYALACADTYYHGENSSEAAAEIARRVEASINGTYRTLLDPIALSELNADIPFWSPREYFLRILELRVKQVLSKWQDIVECILQRTEPYFHPPSSIYPTDTMASDDPERHASFRRIQRSINQTITFMDNVIAMITKTIDAWKTFRGADAKHLADLTALPGRPGWPSMLLQKIDSHMTNLGAMCRDIEAQRQRLRTLGQQGFTDLQQDTVNIAVNSQQTGERMMLLTIVTVVILGPLAIIIEVFAMEDSILPFPKTPLALVIAVICFTAFIIAIATAVSRYSWHRRLLRKLKGVQGATGMPFIPLGRRTQDCDIEMGSLSRGASMDSAGRWQD